MSRHASAPRAREPRSATSPRWTPPAPAADTSRASTSTRAARRRNEHECEREDDDRQVPSSRGRRRTRGAAEEVEERLGDGERRRAPRGGAVAEERARSVLKSREREVEDPRGPAELLGVGARPRTARRAAPRTLARVVRVNVLALSAASSRCTIGSVRRRRTRPRPPSRPRSQSTSSRSGTFREIERWCTSARQSDEIGPAARSSEASLRSRASRGRRRVGDVDDERAGSSRSPRAWSSRRGASTTTGRRRSRRRSPASAAAIRA